MHFIFLRNYECTAHAHLADTRIEIKQLRDVGVWERNVGFANKGWLNLEIASVRRLILWAAIFFDGIGIA